MSEELIQRNLVEAPEKMGDWNFYNIGATTLKALKGAKIIPDRDYEEFEGKKPDALIVKKPGVIAAIEYKPPAQLRTDKQVEKAIAQELGTAHALQARVYIVTDGKKSYWINPATGNEILQEDGSRITLNFDKNSTDCITLINKIRASISATNDRLKAAAAVDPLPLAERVWQDLWAVSGATPENCLYTFVEIFIFKYLSDLGVLKGMYSFYDLLGRYSGNNENEVLEYYASTVRVKIKELFPGNPKDKTTIINGTIFVSKDDKAVSGYDSLSCTTRRAAPFPRGRVPGMSAGRFEGFQITAVPVQRDLRRVRAYTTHHRAPFRAWPGDSCIRFRSAAGRRRERPPRERHDN